MKTNSTLLLVEKRDARGRKPDPQMDRAVRALGEVGAQMRVGGGAEASHAYWAGRRLGVRLARRRLQDGSYLVVRVG